jgi:eukaryotic-like serine/threonine-protein kinase
MIVEDQEMVRLGLQIALNQMENFEVVGVAADGASAIAKALELVPDVILLDIGLPDLNGIEVAKRIKAADPKIHLIMFTSHTDDESVFAALAAGADGYCNKDASSKELSTAITTVCQGAIWLAPAIAERVLRNCTVSGASDSTRKLSFRSPHLVPRELQILSLIVQEMSGEQIAARLDLDISTVLSEMHEVMNKLANSDRAKNALAAMVHFDDSGEQESLTLQCCQCGAQFRDGSVSCPIDGAPLTALGDLLIGKVFADRYDIVSQLGAGGTSTVYKARHKFMDKYVAIKIMHTKLVPDITSVKRFRHESQMMSTLNHPNIVTAFDFGITSEGQVFLIMDYLEGLTLAAEIKAFGHIPVERAMRIFMQLCDALEYAHFKQIVHRDLKPGNIILVQESNRESVKIVDFGIAKSLASGSQNAGFTRAGEVFGSPAYMSPEQCCDSPVDERSDIYSLGCLIFECLTGRPPFRGANVSETIRQHVFERAPSMSEITNDKIPSGIEQLVLQCLEKDPARRPQSISQLKTALTQVSTTV